MARIVSVLETSIRDPATLCTMPLETSLHAFHSFMHYIDFLLVYITDPATEHTEDFSLSVQNNKGKQSKQIG